MSPWRLSTAKSSLTVPTPTPPAQYAVDLIAMDQGAAPPAACGETIGEHAQHRGIGFALQVAVRPGALNEAEELALVPLLRIDLRRDLLGEHVNWRLRHDQPVQFAAIGTVDQRGAFDEVVIGEGEQAPLWLSADA